MTMVPLKFERFVSEEALVETVVDRILKRVLGELEEKGVFHLSLTGGTTGNLVARGLVEHWNESEDDFSGLHIWWSDERFLPRLDPERNDREVCMGLTEMSPIHLHPSLASDEIADLDTATKRYAADLHGLTMDLVLLGVGPDGHVASLFPGQWKSAEMADVIAIKNSPKAPAERLSFSMKKINESGSVWLLASGALKRDVVSRIRLGDSDIPVTAVQGREETLIFVDNESLPGEMDQTSRV